jgi:hypothetical protein
MSIRASKTVERSTRYEPCESLKRAKSVKPFSTSLENGVLGPLPENADSTPPIFVATSLPQFCCAFVVDFSGKLLHRSQVLHWCSTNSQHASNQHHDLRRTLKEMQLSSVTSLSLPLLALSLNCLPPLLLPTKCSSHYYQLLTLKMGANHCSA